MAVLVSSLFSTIEKNSIKGAEDTTMQAAAADANLAPIGSVNAVDKSIVKAARSGDAVYNAVCTSCHAAGVLGAPKIDDKAAWAPRVAQGLDGLMKNAVNGIRSMPARGGDPTITDEELSNAIVYMTGKAGHDLSSQVKAAAPAGDAAKLRLQHLLTKLLHQPLLLKRLAAPAAAAAAPAAAEKLLQLPLPPLLLIKLLLLPLLLRQLLLMRSCCSAAARSCCKAPACCR